MEVNLYEDILKMFFGALFLLSRNSCRMASCLLLKGNNQCHLNGINFWLSRLLSNLKIIIWIFLLNSPMRFCGRFDVYNHVSWDNDSMVIVFPSH